jgi:hypothetical protein
VRECSKVFLFLVRLLYDVLLLSTLSPFLSSLLCLLLLSCCGISSEGLEDGLWWKK